VLFGQRKIAKREKLEDERKAIISNKENIDIENASRYHFYENKQEFIQLSC